MPSDSNRESGHNDRRIRDQQFTVLLADDDDAFRESLRIWLLDDGRWDIVEAANGREALDKLNETVDVLVLDRNMPLLSGTEVVEQLDNTTFDGDVVVLSALHTDEILNERDVTSYATKPIGADEFISHLERALR